MLQKLSTDCVHLTLTNLHANTYTYSRCTLSFSESMNVTTHTHAVNRSRFVGFSKSLHTTVKQSYLLIEGKFVFAANLKHANAARKYKKL